MLAAPSRDWNVFQQIFAEHWDEFQRAHPRYQTSYYDGLVAKMLACGNPEKMGYLAQTPPRPPLRQCVIPPTGFSPGKTSSCEGLSMAQNAIMYYTV